MYWELTYRVTSINSRGKGTAISGGSQLCPSSKMGESWWFTYSEMHSIKEFEDMMGLPGTSGLWIWYDRSVAWSVVFQLHGVLCHYNLYEDVSR